MLLVTWAADRKEYTLWTCEKTGGGLQTAARFGVDAQWHLDVFNSRIRVVKQLGARVHSRISLGSCYGGIPLVLNK